MGTYLGQNFLVDTKVQNYIAEKVKQIYDQNHLKSIIEIGPGRGAITKKIKDISDKFFVIEKDMEMKGYLENILSENQIYFMDVLESNVENLVDVDANQILLVGNLPYYITSPIFRKFFGNGECKFAGGFFMIQDEVGKKIQTTADKKSYLWRLVNYGYDIIYHKTVGAKSFNPPPKVTSCLVEFKKKQNCENIDFDKLVEFLDLYSPFSRKTLGAINKILAKQGKNIFEISDEYIGKRLEELTKTDLKNMLDLMK